MSGRRIAATMTICKAKWMIRLAGCCAFAACAIASQSGQTGAIRRLYVEPFVTKVGADTLRGDLIAQLRKDKSVALVSTESSADAILGGGGEVWIRGYRYRGLYPRSGPMASAGTPIYAGYLSVELRNPKGATIWSYLATPGFASEDISKDLSKLIAKHVAEALVEAEARPAKVTLPQPATLLKGAGATFPYPVYAKWITNYQRENPAVQIDYQAVGSEAGIHKLLAGDVDFGATESPEAIHEITPGEEGRYLQFPSVVGAVVPVVNLPGLANDIKFTPEALAGIYLGKIKKWNDPELQRANRGVRLPDLDITVVHRADGSGTTYAWTDYLSRTSPGWKAQVGRTLDPKWPVGRGATGNEGVAQLVKELGGSIGYVEFIYALKNHLSFGKVQNRAGEFIAASLESIAAAVNRSAGIGDDFKGSIVDPPGEGAYPIASFTWLVVPIHPADETKRNAMAGFLQWVLGPGQRQAAALGYLALPKDTVSKEGVALARIR
jgi:phosphate ABC transporter phosphate-binding protein